VLACCRQEADRHTRFLSVAEALKPPSRADNSVSYSLHIARADMSWKPLDDVILPIYSSSLDGTEIAFGKLTALRTGGPRDWGSIIDRRIETKQPHMQ
jgi:hypothetical protein